MAIMLSIHKLNGTLNLGTLLIDEDPAKSSRTLLENTQSFSELDPVELQQMSNFTGFSEPVINDYVNYHNHYDYYKANLLLNYRIPKQAVFDGVVAIDYANFSSADIYVYTQDHKFKFRIVSLSGQALNNSGNYGEGSSTKTSARYEYYGDKEEGWYEVYSHTRGKTRAHLDLGLSPVKDSYGSLIVPIPLVKFEKNEQGSLLESTLIRPLKRMEM